MKNIKIPVTQKEGIALLPSFEINNYTVPDTLINIKEGTCSIPHPFPDIHINFNERVKVIPKDEFDFEIKYKKGKDNVVADALSRIEVNVNEIESIIPNAPNDIANLQDFNTSENQGIETDKDDNKSTEGSLHSNRKTRTEKQNKKPDFPPSISNEDIIYKKSDRRNKSLPNYIPIKVTKKNKNIIVGKLKTNKLTKVHARKIKRLRKKSSFQDSNADDGGVDRNSSPCK
ncbi:hypothetical protein HHI36_018055 [Cryptolaemus montrouzieri]|uniref:Uncharacterized protein n=1 Tax=Cryptolaemus montrouzieri TaxID=559131 RepID=A0ABD2NZT9_9CUCU